MALFQSLTNRRQRSNNNAGLGTLTDRQLEDLGVERAFVRRERQAADKPIFPNEAWPA